MYSDPQNQSDRCTLTPRQLVALAKREKWGTRKIYGRIWISTEDFKRWLSNQQKESPTANKGVQHHDTRHNPR